MNQVRSKQGECRGDTSSPAGHQHNCGCVTRQPGLNPRSTPFWVYYSFLNFLICQIGRLMSTAAHLSEDKKRSTGLYKKYNKYPFSPFICSFMLKVLPYSEFKHNTCMLRFNNHGDFIFKSIELIVALAIPIGLHK